MSNAVTPLSAELRSELREIADEIDRRNFDSAAKKLRALTDPMGPPISVYATERGPGGARLVTREVPLQTLVDEMVGVVRRPHNVAATRAELAAAKAEIDRLTAAPATVGGLLATAPAGSIVEWRDAHARWRQCRIGFELGDPVWCDRAWVGSRWRGWCAWMGVDVDAFVEPARLVPADQTDADPATRGPIGGAPDWSCPRRTCGGRMEGGEFFEGATNRCTRCGGEATFTGSGWQAIGGGR